ncbi:MAG: hypothetical protein ACRD1Z_01095, partial [Vicinamibacteria bacterium]
ATQAAQQDEAQLNAYYAQYGPTYLHHMGYTPEVWAKFSVAEKRTTIEKLGDGTIQPHMTPKIAEQAVAASPAAQQQIVQTAGLSQAMKQVYGDQIPGEGVTAPAYLQPSVNAAASEYQKQILASGTDNFLSTAIKAAGQAGAVNALYDGLGSELPGGMKDVFGKVQGSLPKAFDAGSQDIKSDGAAVGAGGAVKTAIDRGTESGVPWVPILIGVGTLAGVGIVLSVARG